MLVDAEHAFDPAYSKALGVDVENLIVCQPDHGEMALESKIFNYVHILLEQCKYCGSILDTLIDFYHLSCRSNVQIWCH